MLVSIDFCCNIYNKMNNKIEQGRIGANVVIITSIKLNKSLAFFEKVCHNNNAPFVWWGWRLGDWTGASHPKRWWFV